MSGNTEKNLVPAVESNVTYAKLRPLTSEEANKGLYAAIGAGDTVTGTFLSSREDNYGKQNYSIKQGDGSIIVLAGQGNLGRQMSAVEPGNYVEVTYNGKKEITSGQWKGKDSHSFTVLKEQI